MDDFKIRLQSCYHKLSGSQKKIAEYLLENFEKAAFLTASRLGNLVQVSESTVIRFANTLGYNGYPELQEEFREILRTRFTAVSCLKESSSFKAARSPDLAEILNIDLQNLSKTLAEISPDVFEKAVEEIISAPFIYILGLRSAHCLALFLGFYLEMIGKHVKVIPQGTNSIFEQFTGAGAGDLAIGISFPCYTRQTIEGVAYAQKKGCRILALTDTVLSPLAQIADITLTAETNTGSFVESFVAPLSVINALIIAVGRKEGKQVTERLEQLEEIWERYRIYYLSSKHDKQQRVAAEIK
ncbi:MAG: MurR/RpiR family transcriptional regulator [Firmicutes bacterium]|nr:MurR/RpiR family transcriptional regulator [Bacillota bacterium]